MDSSFEPFKQSSLMFRLKARRGPWVERERRVERPAEGAEEENNQDVCPGKTNSKCFANIKLV